MLKLLAEKQKQQQEAANSASSSGKKISPAQLRVQKDLTELELPKTIKTYFPNPDDTLHFLATITPDEGYYKNGEFKFSFNVNENFPHEPPKVKCLQKIYHPNIDLEGNVCLNILREDWKPVLNLTSVLVGLQFLFLEPNPTDPLNKDAAVEFMSNQESFNRSVKLTMKGGRKNNIQFDNVMKNK